MSTRSLLLLALAVILLGGSTLAIPRVPAPAAAWASGFGGAHEIPSGTLYKSPTHTFTVSWFLSLRAPFIAIGKFPSNP